MRRLGGPLVSLVLLLAGCASDGSDDAARADARPGGAATVEQDPSCTWPMAGQNLRWTHATGCDEEGAVGADTVDRLVPVWFTETRAEVTGAPAVTEDALYFGDGTGSLRRIRFVDGEPQAPELMAAPLDFPDGIGVWLPAS